MPKDAPARREADAYDAALSRLAQTIAARIAKAKPPKPPTLWRRIGRALGTGR